MDVVRALLGSKKFVTSMIGMVVSIAVYLGLDLELAKEIVPVVVKITLGFVLAQGIADHGKEKVIAEGAIVAMAERGTEKAEALGSPPA